MKPFSVAALKSKSCQAKRSQCSGARNAPARVLQRVTVLERLGDGFTGVVSKVQLPDGRHAALKESHANLTNTKAMTRVHLEATMQRRLVPASRQPSCSTARAGARSSPKWWVERGSRRRTSLRVRL